MQCAGNRHTGTIFAGFNLTVPIESLIYGGTKPYDNIVGKIMKKAGAIIRTDVSRCVMVLGVAMLGMLAAPRAVAATVYTFTIPTGVQGTPDPSSILGALDIAVQQAALGNRNPLLDGFYDF